MCAVRSEDSRADLAEGVRSHWFVHLLKVHCSLNRHSLLTLNLRRLTPLKPSGHYTWSVPKVMRMIFYFCAAQKGQERKMGVEAGGGGNPGIQFDLPQLSPRTCSSRYVSNVRGRFCVLSRAKMERSVEHRYAIEFCAKLGKSDSETSQLLRTA